MLCEKLKAKARPSQKKNRNQAKIPLEQDHRSVGFKYDGAQCFNHIPSLKKLENALSDMVRYLELNADSMPNYGKRYRAGQRISAGFVESAVNEIVAKRMVKKQQMRWNRTLSRVSSMFAFTC
jgi:hypothetical protein